MRYGACIIACLLPVCLAQQESSLALLRGIVSTINSNRLAVRFGDVVHNFRTDDHTWVERNDHRIRLDELKRGEIVDVVSDRAPGIPYARLVKVFVRPRLPSLRLPPGQPFDFPSTLFPRGRLTFSGIVMRLAKESMTLRLRTGGTREVLLRDDTGYRSNGRPSDRSNLRTQTRVYVRADKNLDGELEAYEVVWGDILQPDGVR